jgi:hypothetical protein
LIRKYEKFMEKGIERERYRYKVRGCIGGRGFIGGKGYKGIGV